MLLPPQFIENAGHRVCCRFKIAPPAGQMHKAWSVQKNTHRTFTRAGWLAINLPVVSP